MDVLRRRAARITRRRLEVRHLSTSKDTKEALRNLLRETAQPVAVVTSLYPLDGGETTSKDSRIFHGATLSSFTSIALDPTPLVAFSLRIPSRMATSLKQLMARPPRSVEAIGKPTASPADFVVNILSSDQAETAYHFARADLFPDPFRITPHVMTQDGLPVLSGALGALSCSLVENMALEDLCGDGDRLSKDGLISELFISRVLRVEQVGVQAAGTGALPLLYHHRRYATARFLDDKQP